jgi:hypothetical protein
MKGEPNMANGWCEAAEGGEGGGAIWHNPAEVVLDGDKVVVIEEDRRYPDPRRSEFSLDGLLVEIREKPGTLEDGVEIWGSLILQEKGGNWFTRVLNTLLGKKEVKFEASERAPFEALCEEIQCQP